MSVTYVESALPDPGLAFLSSIGTASLLSSHGKGKKIMLKFIQSIASFRGDLSALTAPPFLLSTFSHVEFPSLWTENSATSVAPSLEPDPEERALLVLKWFLNALNQQYAGKSDNLGGRSPLNPYLGELSLGKWDDTAGCSQLIAEQVW